MFHWDVSPTQFVFSPCPESWLLQNICNIKLIFWGQGKDTYCVGDIYGNETRHEPDSCLFLALRADFSRICPESSLLQNLRAGRSHVLSSWNLLMPQWDVSRTLFVSSPCPESWLVQDIRTITLAFEGREKTTIEFVKSRGFREICHELDTCLLPALRAQFDRMYSVFAEYYRADV